MSNNIINQINEELNSLKKQLNKFIDTVNYLSNAKNDVENAVNAVITSETFLNTKVEELKSTHNSFLKLSDTINNIIQKIDSIDFPERLTSIESSIKDTLSILTETKDSTLLELNKASEVISNADFDGRFKTLESLIESSNTNSFDLVKSINKLKIPDTMQSFELSINKRLHESLKDVQKKNDEIAVTNTKIITDLNLPLKIDKLDLSISGIMAAIQAIQSRLDLLDRNMSDKFRDLQDYQKLNLEAVILDNSKKQKYLNYFLIVIGFINISLLVFVLLKK